MSNNNLNKKILGELEVDFSPRIHSVDLMDKFDGVYSDTMYSKLILKNYTYYENNCAAIFHLVVERPKEDEKIKDSGVTFTELKCKKAYKLDIALSTQITQEIVLEYFDKNKIFYLKDPIILKAQNSDNKTGYGDIWDWSFSKDYPLVEGTKYGDTNYYKITGIYIEFGFKFM